MFAFDKYLFVSQSVASLEDNFVPADASTPRLLRVWILSPRISHLYQGERISISGILDAKKSKFPD